MVLTHFFQLGLKVHLVEDQLAQLSEDKIMYAEEQQKKDHKYQDKATQLARRLLALDEEVFTMFDVHVGSIISYSDLDAGEKEKRDAIEKSIRRASRFSNAQMWFIQGILLLEVVLFVIMGRVVRQH